MSKQVQIPYDLYVELVKYFLGGYRDNEGFIKSELNNKFESAIKRELYTLYKTAPTPEQREQARQDYLDKIGVPPSFRW